MFLGINDPYLLFVLFASYRVDINLNFKEIISVVGTYIKFMKISMCSKWKNYSKSQKQHKDRITWLNRSKYTLDSFQLTYMYF